MLDALVLDFDGVVANTEPLHCQTFQEILAAEAIELTEEEYYARYLGFSDVAAFRTIAGEHGRTWNDAAIADLIGRKFVRLEQLERERSILFPGADAFIRTMSAFVPLAIASGALRAEILRVLDCAGLTPFFTAIVGAEDAAASKPAPDPYVRALQKLADAQRRPVAPERSVAIEDSQWGLQSARAAGLRTVAITNSYDGGSLDADLVIPSLTSLDVTVLRSLVTT